MKTINIIRNNEITNSCTAPEAEALAWLSRHEGMGTFGDSSQYSVEIIDVTDKLAQDKINAESEAYLASTDWLIVREVETGVVCPAEVKAERQAARQRIVK